MASRQIQRLAQRTIVVTRPAAQAGRLTQMLQAEGAQVVQFPVIDIVPMEDLTELERLSGSLADFDRVFFVSANAVEFAFRVLDSVRWPSHVEVSTVGPATVRALNAHGFGRVIAPQGGFDTEAVLELPQFQATAVKGRKILILRGESDGGSRELLAETLREYGAEIRIVACYQRVGAQLPVAPLLDLLAKDALDALTFTSSEGVRYFSRIAGEHLPALFQRPCFAPHERIVEQLQTLGAGQAHVTAAADEGLLSALCEYFSDRV